MEMQLVMFWMQREINRNLLHENATFSSMKSDFYMGSMKNHWKQEIFFSFQDHTHTLKNYQKTKYD